MKLNLKKASYLLFIISLLAGIIFLVINLFDVQANKIKYKDKISNKAFRIFISLPDTIKSSLLIISGKRSFNNLFNDYNIKFLPDTENLKLNLKKISTSFNKSESKTFFIDIIEDNLILVTKSGEFYLENLTEVAQNKVKKIKKKIVVKNLITENRPVIINDILVINNKVFILNAVKDKECNKLKIHVANFDEILDFSLFKEFDECVGFGLVGGGMQEFYLNNNKGILVSTASSNNNLLTSEAQNDESILGKILFVNSSNKDVAVISKGHRNPQGLAVQEDIILSTEHGPKGGDEINKIVFGSNYGWPISSYGKPYANEKNINFKQNHEKNGFKEPLYVFLSAVGISELIFLPNTFHEQWQDNTIVSSLNGRSLFRIKFKSNKYENIIFKEKIFIGERIRDLKYFDKFKMIILALEDTGIVGILTLNKMD